MTEQSMPQMKPDEPAARHEPASQREERALTTVKRYATWSAFGGIIPVPVVDVLAVGGLQLQMLRRLAAIYDISFSENRGKSVIASLIGAIFPASTTASTMGVASALKVVPAVGSAVGLIMMPSLAAGATYVIGKVFIQHFASGGTLLDFKAPDYSEYIRSTAGAFGGRFSRKTSPTEAAEH